jgi:4-amino-4-deoxy-L-arabinose transferase-like glycosyltransferase
MNRRTPKQAHLLSGFILGALGVLAVSSLLFFYRLADRDLWSSHEARAGMDAQVLLDDGAWGLPHLFDGRPEMQKPPLYYWLVAGLAWLRGGRVDAWAVRLPSALAALGCVLALVFGAGRALGRHQVGLLAGAVLATAAHFTWLARIGRIDMPLTLAVTVAAGGMYLARKAEERRKKEERQMFFYLLPSFFRLLSYLAVAAGVLLKGPVGLALPAAVVALHLLLEGEWPACWEVRAWGRLARGLGLWWGGPLVLALTLPWFLWADAATGGEFFRVFIRHHNFERALGGSTLRANPWWFYGPQLVADFFPWSPLLLLAAVACYRRGYWRRDPELRFGAAWLLAVLLVLSWSRFKRADYLLPAYPGAALFLACALRHQQRGFNPKAALAVPGLVAVVAVGWLVQVGYRLPAAEPTRDYRRFAAEVRRLAPAPAEVLFFRTEAHALAFHMGRPLAVVVEWKDLGARVARPGVHYVVMPPGCTDEWPRSLQGVRLEEVMRNTDLSGGRHERPLVLLRTCGPGTTAP